MDGLTAYFLHGADEHADPEIQQATQHPFRLGLLIPVYFCDIALLYLKYYFLLRMNSMLRPLALALFFLLYFILPVLPHFLLMRHYEPYLSVSRRETLRRLPKLRFVLGSAFAVSLLFFAKLLLVPQTINGMHLYAWIAFILAAYSGFFEEYQFRACFLNFVGYFTKEWKANMVISLLFALSHYPKWMLEGQLSLLKLLTNTCSIWCLSFLFGYLFQKSKSVWPSVIAHFLWDFFLYYI